MTLKSADGLGHIASMYGPTSRQDASERLTFLEDFQALWTDAPSREPLFAIGDFNARVGHRRPDAIEAVQGGSRPRSVVTMAEASALCFRVLMCFFHHDVRAGNEGKYSRIMTPNTTPTFLHCDSAVWNNNTSKLASTRSKPRP